MNLKYLIFSILILMLFMTASTEAQRRAPRSNTKTSITGKAASSWKTFFPTFVAAVRNKDRKYLRSVMSGDFSFSFGYGSGRDGAFDYFDKSSNYGNGRGSGKNGWRKLQDIINKGVVPDQAAMRSGSKRPTFIAPPRSGIGCRSSWEFYGDRWHWIYFVCGD